MAAKQRTVAPNLEKFDQNNPPQGLIQALSLAAQGHMIKHRSWPEGKFIALNEATEDSEMRDPAFSIVSPDGSSEPWTPTLSDLSTHFIRYIPQLEESK